MFAPDSFADVSISAAHPTELPVVRTETGCGGCGTGAKIQARYSRQVSTSVLVQYQPRTCKAAAMCFIAYCRGFAKLCVYLRTHRRLALQD